MTLRAKTVLIFGLTLTVLLVLLFLISKFILLGGFSGLEEDAVGNDVQQALNSIADDQANFASISKDWANWDDTYDFIDDHNQGFIDSNLLLDTSWTNNHVNLMAFIDSQGRVVYANSYDIESKQFLPVSQGELDQIINEPRIRDNPGDEGKYGLVMLPEGPMTVSSQMILTSSREGPGRGTLIWGRFLDADQVARLSRITNLDLQVSAYDAEVDQPSPSSSETTKPALATSGIMVNPLDGETVAGSGVVDDFYGDPALTVQVSVPRTIYQHGLGTMRYMFGSLLAIGLLFSGMTLLLLERLVLSRVAKLSADVEVIGTQEDHSLRVTTNGSDELASLGGGINKMLSALENTQTQLRDANDLLDHRVRERTEELHGKIEALKALTEIDQEIMAASDSLSVVKLVCKRSAELLRVPKAMVALGSSTSFHVISHCGIDISQSLEEELLPLLRQRFSAAGGGVITIDDIDLEPVLVEIAAEEDFKSIVAAPLIADSKMSGTIVMLDTEVRDWTADEVQIIGLPSDQLAQAIDKTRLFEAEESRREELSALYDLSRSLAGARPDFQEILELVTRHAVETVHVTYSQVVLIDGNELVVRAAHPRRMLRNFRVGQHVCLDTLPAIREVMRGDIPVIIHDSGANLLDNEKEVLFQGVVTTACIVPLHIDGRPLGVLVLGEERKEERESFSAEKISLARSVGEQTASALRRAELFYELEQAYLQTVMSLANAVDAKDNYTHDHSSRLAEQALAVGRGIGMSPDQLEDLRFGAILHDVGKIGIPDKVLKKPARLTDSEWKLMREHPEIGARILDPVPRLKGAASIVRHHHERYEGGGYPDGLSGEQIPIGARILTVVDSYSAMVDRRVYREARTPEKAMAEIRRCTGTQFDPVISEIFLRMLEEGNFAAA